MVRRALRKYGYPPDKQERAIRTVLAQAEVIAQDWAASSSASTSDSVAAGSFTSPEVVADDEIDLELLLAGVKVAFDREREA